jgi:hypothetical protein
VLVAVVGDAVVRRRCDQKGEDEKVEDKRGEIYTLRHRGQTPEARMEDCLKLKAQENLGPQDQDPDFVQNVFYFYFECDSLLLT